MNKKILFLSLLAVLIILPAVSFAAGSFGDIVKQISQSLTGLAASLATIGFVVSGILYIASTSNPSMAGAAKTALVAAVIGTVIALLAGTACDFVKGFTGAGGSC